MKYTSIFYHHVHSSILLGSTVLVPTIAVYMKARYVYFYIASEKTLNAHVCVHWLMKEKVLFLYKVYIPILDDVKYLNCLSVSLFFVRLFDTLRVESMVAD